MAIRSFYISWDQGVRDGDSLLDDLSELTKLNTLELTNYDSDWTAQDAAPASLVFPSERPFKGLGLHLTTKRRFELLDGFMEMASSKGFDVLCNFSPLYVNSSKFVERACVDVTGGRVPGLNRLAAYGCPNDPEVLAYGEVAIRETVAAWRSASLIAVNHVEFPFWPQSSLSETFSCFCSSCKKRAGAEGIDLTSVRREVKPIYDSLSGFRPGEAGSFEVSPGTVLNYLARHPEIGVWLDFRRRSLTRYISAVVRAGREASKDGGRRVRIGLEFLPPTVAGAAGADFAALYRELDWISPKFPEYLTASVIPWIAERATNEYRGRKALMDSMRALFGLGAGPASLSKNSDQSEGLTYAGTFDPAMIDEQMKHLLPLVGKVDIHPYTWLYDGDLRALGSRLERFRSYGLEGHLIWGWERNLKRAALRKVRGVF